MVDRVVFDGARWLGRFDRRQVAGIERRNDVERGLEGERLAFFEDEVLDVGRFDRLDTLFDERVADRLRHQVLGDVLHDLGLEALADHVGRDLAGAEAGDFRGASELRGGVADGFVNNGAGHLDRQIAARFVHVNNF